VEHWWNDTEGKALSTLRKTWPSVTSTTDSTWISLGSNKGLLVERLVTNCPSCGTAWKKEL